MRFGHGLIAKKMKAIHLSNDWPKLMDVSRALYIEHGWDMPRGMIDQSNRSLSNFTMAQWQHAKRIGKVPRKNKQDFQECWTLSDSKSGFENALKEQGYWLAKGDRAGFVVLDHACEIFALGTKWMSVKVKDIRAKLGSKNKLRSVAEVKAQIAHDMAQHLTSLQNQQSKAIEARTRLIDDQLRQLVAKQRRERQDQKEAQILRWQNETKQRQARFNKGLRGMIDRFTGKHRQTKKHNEYETQQAKQRDEKEKDQLIFKQADQRQSLQRRVERLEEFRQNRSQTLSNDIEQYKGISTQHRDVFELRQNHRIAKGPTHER